MIELTLRRLRHRWRLDLAVLLGLIVLSAVVASLVGYATAVSGRELSRTLDAVGPAQRTLLITGNLATFSEELYIGLQEALGISLQERLVIRHTTLPADPPSENQPAERRTVDTLALYSFDKLAENVHVVEGRLPAPVRLFESVGFWPPPMEAVIGRHAAEQSSYAIGDRVTATHYYHRLDIVGIVEPADPDADLWGGDLRSFAVPTSFGQPDEAPIALPLIIAPESMQSYLRAPVFPHDMAWRITLDLREIGPDAAQALRSALANWQAQSATRGAITSTGLLQLLDDFLARASRVRTALWVLTAQTWLLGLYALTLFASLLVDGARFEVAALAARGMSAWQITRLWALEHMVVAVPAGLLGPGLAYAMVRLWIAGAGTTLEIGFPGDMWLLSAASAAAGWFILTISVAVAAWRAVRRPTAPPPRPGKGSSLHRRYVDLYLLAFGALLVWQLNRSGSFLARIVTRGRLGDVSLADPLLMLGPFMLSIAVALVFLRIVPLLLGLAARPFRHRRGLLLPLGLLRPARDSRRPSQLVLLVSLATGLSLFASILSKTLAQGQESPHSDALVQGIAEIFRLDAVTLALVGVGAFLLAHLMAAKGPERTSARAGELGILRALGLSARRWAILPVVEGIVVFLVGLPSGIVLGLGIAYTMAPSLLESLVEPLMALEAGAGVRLMVANWALIGRVGIGLVALYALALAFAWFALRGKGYARAPWIDDE
jgi:hypothetical protein